MPKTNNLELNIGFNEANKNSIWINEKDENFEILDMAYGTVFNSAEENGIAIKKSENHPSYDQ